MNITNQECMKLTSTLAWRFCYPTELELALVHEGR